MLTCDTAYVATQTFAKYCDLATMAALTDIATIAMMHHSAATFAANSRRHVAIVLL